MTGLARCAARSIALPAGLALLAGLAVPAAAQPRAGGTLTIVQGAEPAALVSGMNTSTFIGTVSTKIHEGLLDYDFDLKPRPALAESWTVAPDGKTYTFKLRRGVSWHDGKPFTSADVKFSLEEIWKKLHPRGRVTFARVASVETPDATTVVLKLADATPMLLAALSAYESQVLPRHVYEGKDFTTNPALNAPIGTGPFVFKEWRKGDYIRLEKNPAYWDKGKPYLDAIVVRIIPDAAARAAAIEKGEVQLGVFNPVPLADVKRLAALPTVKAETRGYEFFAPMYVMEANLRQEHLKDKRVRQAIMHALDRKFVTDNLWFGFAKPATGPIASSSPFYTTQGVPQYPYDVARANKILDDAGFKRSANNMRFKLSLTFPPVQPEIPRTAEYIKQALARAGIEVDLQNIDLATFIRQVYNWEFELTQNYLYLLPDPILGVQRLYVSSNIKKGTPFANAAGYENKDVDAAFAAAQIENDPGKRKELFARVQRQIQEDLPAFNLFELTFVTLYNAKVVNHTLGADGPYGSFKETYLEP
ncbi:MAG: ABC transporter substrate-binding protein [Candidatus Rokubacteria bacterium]|nr:ABC transporter substrate-binding protein [Candidatus Rokubacteria bacterium]